VLGPTPHPRFAPSEARRPRAAEGMTAGAVIPYDAVASFRIIGRAGNLLQDVISISTDGVFVATAIGVTVPDPLFTTYAFEPSGVKATP